MIRRESLEKLSNAHPWLIAVAPILFLLAHSSAGVDWEIVFAALGISLLGATILWGITRLILRNADKASLLTTLCLILFFTYGYWFNIIRNAHLLTHLRAIHHFLLMDFAFIFAVSTYWIIRAKHDLRMWCRVFTGILTIGVVIWTFEVIYGNRIVLWHDRIAYTQAQTKRPAPFSKDDPKHPDVYHILLDGYARHDKLLQYYRYDNQEFISFLRSRGFYVADQSVANYPMSFMSIASTLNMRYLTKEIDQHRKGGITSRDYFLDLVRDHEVGRTFQSLGYSHIHFNTTFQATEASDDADLVYSFSYPLLNHEFTAALIRTTMLRELEPSVVDLHRFTLRRLRDIPKLKGPTYTFAHVLMPHMPFVFDREGNVRDDVPQESQFVETSAGWNAKSEYVDQLVFLDGQIEQLIDHILKTSKYPPIIVIHSDHGTASNWPEPGSAFEQWGTLIDERTPILCAMYVPEKMRKDLYPTITPVNMFRLIFTDCFGLNFPRLRDRSFFAWYDQPYFIHEVTSQVLPTTAPATLPTTRPSKPAHVFAATTAK
jgi:hypothetical protein